MPDPIPGSVEVAYGAIVLNDGDPRVASMVRERDFLDAIHAKMAVGMTFMEAFAAFKLQVMKQVRRSLQ